MVKKIVRRHRLMAVPFLFIVGGVSVPGQSLPESPMSTPPAQVVVQRAVIVKHGAQVEWLEGQPGSHPIKSYIIERSRKNEPFGKIAQIGKEISSFTDVDGQRGDSYRIIAEDTHKPSARSTASEPAAATAVSPADIVSEASASYATEVTAQAPTAEAKAHILQKTIPDTFSMLHKAVKEKDTKRIRERLTALQDYQQQLLMLLPKLSPAKKQAAAKICKNHGKTLKAGTKALSVQDKMDGLVVLAQCKAIQKGIQ